MERKNEIILGDAKKVLKTLESCSVDMCVTSPPYYALRDYGVDGQFGLEETPEEYISKLADVFDEVYRVLKDDGTLWVNIGDSYNGSKKGNTNAKWESTNTDTFEKKRWVGAKPKDLIGIPWMLAFELRSRGWYLRQDIIWHKPNPMPESVKDRCTKSHEYLFLLSKSQQYYFDYEAIQEQTEAQGKPRVFGAKNQEGTMRGDIGRAFTPKTNVENGEEHYVRNKRDVWSVNLQPTKEAHFATFPQKLIAPCILAGSKMGGVVLDPFMGSGTTALVAKKLQRYYIGVELNPDYKKIADKRIAEVGTDLFGF